MAYNKYQNIPIDKFIYRYDDAEEVMKSMNISDESIATVISHVISEDKIESIPHEEEIKKLIEKLREENEQIKKSMEILENSSPIIEK
jgi:hypothetical protein